jgi:hypothetical protein
MPAERRIATLLTFARRLEAQDDALDVLYVLTAEMISQLKGKKNRERLQTIKDLAGRDLLAHPRFQYPHPCYIPYTSVIGFHRSPLPSI